MSTYSRDNCVHIYIYDMFMYTSYPLAEMKVPKRRQIRSCLVLMSSMLDYYINLNTSRASASYGIFPHQPKHGVQHRYFRFLRWPIHQIPSNNQFISCIRPCLLRSSHFFWNFCSWFRILSRKGKETCSTQWKWMAGWWFQKLFIFTPIWGNNPIWLIFFRWVETTN